MDERQFLSMLKQIGKEGGELENALGDLFSAAPEDDVPNPKETALKLKERFKLFKARYDFEEGCLVSWKKGLKNRRYPRYGEPAIVLKILDRPVFAEEKESGSPYFLEPLDIILGLLINDEFEVFYYDKRRLAPFNEDIDK